MYAWIIHCIKRAREINSIWFSMGTLAKYRIEQAKKRLRETLSYAYIASLPKYKGITRKQYEKLMDSLDQLCLVMIGTYCRINNIEP